MTKVTIQSPPDGGCKFAGYRVDWWQRVFRSYCRQWVKGRASQFLGGLGSVLCEVACQEPRSEQVADIVAEQQAAAESRGEQQFVIDQEVRDRWRDADAVDGGSGSRQRWGQGLEAARVGAVDRRDRLQVKQQKKSSNQWICVVCIKKQSVRKVFAQGFMAKVVPKFVQTFNIRYQFEQQRTNETLDLVPDHTDDQPQSSNDKKRNSCYE
ncbi:hypothetical protein RHSIM_Rhsim06G0189600 [Rhododendron simsii]|uniref:MRN complex-interacting protein N-terminal domain-containing protein n=1 Tax=Rhododendron simsii TaxID=118357 RepID=A0A834LKN9_RHOSS|nr:hypothetical protein RHSIM_Rhsim06G0189600 [Rhododendron simsii]